MSHIKFIKHTSTTVKKHIFEYLLLLSVGVFFLTTLALVRGQRTQQFLVLSMFVIFYISWGLTHHALDKTFKLKIVLEYMLLGAIALFIFQLILL